MKSNIDLKITKYTIIKEEGVNYIIVKREDLKEVEEVRYENHKYMINGKRENMKAFYDGPVFEDHINREGKVIGEQYHFGTYNKELNTKLRIIKNN